jgi:hypothetical protein
VTHRWQRTGYGVGGFWLTATALVLDMKKAE